MAKFNPATKESTFSSSIDVRGTPDAYVARIYVPAGDESKLNVTFDKGTLRISSIDKIAGAFDENIAIPGPVKADKLKIEHKEGIVVVTLPRELERSAIVAAPAAGIASAAATTGGSVSGSWDQQVVREMQRMKDQMD